MLIIHQNVPTHKGKQLSYLPGEALGLSFFLTYTAGLSGVQASIFDWDKHCRLKRCTKCKSQLPLIAKSLENFLGTCVGKTEAKVG